MTGHKSVMSKGPLPCVGSIQSKALLLNISLSFGEREEEGEGPEIIYCKVDLSSHISSSTWQWTSEEVWLGCREFLATLLLRLLPDSWGPLHMQTLAGAFVRRSTHAAHPFWSPAPLGCWVQQSGHILVLFLVKPNTGFVTVRDIWMEHTCLKQTETDVPEWPQALMK